MLAGIKVCGFKTKPCPWGSIFAGSSGLVKYLGTWITCVCWFLQFQDGRNFLQINPSSKVPHVCVTSVQNFTSFHFTTSCFWVIDHFLTNAHNDVNLAFSTTRLQVHSYDNDINFMTIDTCPSVYGSYNMLLVQMECFHHITNHKHCWVEIALDLRQDYPSL